MEILIAHILVDPALSSSWKTSTYTHMETFELYFYKSNNLHGFMIYHFQLINLSSP